MSATLELLRAAQEGDRDACEQAVIENNGLIWSVVRRYYGRGVDPEDLYQLGCLGFLKAVQGFDFDYGTCFSTYAVPSIPSRVRPSAVSRWRDSGVSVAISTWAISSGVRPEASESSLSTGSRPSSCRSRSRMV